MCNNLIWGISLQQVRSSLSGGQAGSDGTQYNAQYSNKASNYRCST